MASSRNCTSGHSNPPDDLCQADLVLEPLGVGRVVKLVGDRRSVEVQHVDDELADLGVIVVSGEDLGSLSVGDEVDVDGRVAESVKLDHRSSV
jgi:hypothetical protein